MNTKLLNFFIGILATSAAGLLIMVIIMVFYPYKTVVYPNLPLNIGKSEYVGGEVVSINIVSTNYSDKPLTITGQLIGDSGVVYDLGTRIRPVPLGENKFTSKIWAIPVGVEPGIYYLDFIATVKVNVLREVNVRSYTTKFNVK